LGEQPLFWTANKRQSRDKEGLFPGLLHKSIAADPEAEAALTEAGDEGTEGKLSGLVIMLAAGHVSGWMGTPAESTWIYVLVCVQ
jgi:hypothetical protein